MAMRTDHDPADRLNRYLDARTADQSADLRLLDPALAQAVEAFFAADDTPGPAPGLAQRIWADALAQTDTPRPMPLPVREPAVANGYGRRGWQPAAPERGPSTLAFLATAALLLLSLGLATAGIRVVGPQVARHVPFAIQAPPTTEPSTDVPDAALPDATLLALTLPDAPRYRTALGTKLGMLPPGSQLAITASPHGPQVIFVVAGPLSLQVTTAPHPVRIIPSTGEAAAGAPDVTLAAGGQTTLAAGATIVASPGVAFTLRPSGSAAAKILLLLDPPDSRFRETNGATWQPTTNGGVTQTVSGPLSLSLRQTTLAPGVTLPAPGGAAQQVVVVADAAQMGDVRSLATGAVRNAGRQPVSLYVLTLTVGGDGPSDVGTPPR
jgi:hypothetical protein